MKDKYRNPFMEIIQLYDIEQIITTSGGWDPDDDETEIISESFD